MADLVALVDYRNPLRRHVVDLDSGAVQSSLCARQQDASENAAGWGTEVAIGLLFRHKVFVAIYVAHRKLCIRIGASQYEGGCPNTRFTRIAVLPFIKVFKVTVRRRSIQSFAYWHEDFDRWPNSRDILAKIEDVTAGNADTVWLVSAPWRRSESAPVDP